MRDKIAELEQRPRLTDADQQRLDRLRAQEELATAEAAKIPDFAEDPEGHVKGAVKPLAEKLDKLEKADQERQAQLAQTQQLQTLLNQVGAKETEFKATTPDYDAALAHVRESRRAELSALYPTATQEQITAQITREEIQTAAVVMQAGANPAATVYKLAELRGYRKAAPPPPPAPPPAAAPDRSAVSTLGGSGGAAAPADTGDDPLDEFTAARRERFGR